MLSRRVSKVLSFPSMPSRRVSKVSEFSVDAVEAGVEGVEFSVDAVEAGVEGVELSVDAVEAGVEGVELSVDAVEAGVEGVELSVDAVEAGVEGVELSVDAVEAGVEGVELSVDTVEAGVEGVELGVDVVEAGIDRVEADVVVGEPAVHAGQQVALPRLLRAQGRQHLVDGLDVVIQPPHLALDLTRGHRHARDRTSHHCKARKGRDGLWMTGSSSRLGRKPGAGPGRVPLPRRLRVVRSGTNRARIGVPGISARAILLGSMPCHDSPLSPSV